MGLFAGTKTHESLNVTENDAFLFCSFYYGVRPIVVVSDQEMVKQILVKDFDSFQDREVNIVW